MQVIATKPIFIPQVVKTVPKAVAALVKRANPTPAILSAARKVHQFRSSVDHSFAALPFHVPEWEDFEPLPSSAFIQEPATLVERLNEECQDLIQYGLGVKQQIQEMKDELEFCNKFLMSAEKDSEKHLATVVQIARLQMRIDRFEKEYQLIDRRWRRCAKAKAIAVRVENKRHAKNEAAWIKSQINRYRRR